VRLPKIVPRSDKVLRWIILAIVLIVESILNGVFFAAGSEMGLIGGVVEAATLSLFNLGGAVLFARYGMPRLVHRRATERIVGVLALFTYILWAITLNLLIAHFRDSYIASSGNVDMAVLWARLIHTPFILSDAESWILAFLGVAFILGAVIDARGLDDPYLGYGDIGRRREDALARYAEQKSRCLDLLQQRRDDAVNDMLIAIHTLKSAEYDLHLATDGLKRDHRTFLAYLEHLAAVHEQLVRRYREANTRARTTTQGPEYFNRPPARPAFLDPPPAPPQPTQSPQGYAVSMERMQYYIERMNSELTAKLVEYKSLTLLTNE
jgi:hypothetical protein